MDISCITLPCTKGRFLGSLSDPGIDLTIVAIESRTVISKIDVIFVMLVVAVVVEVLLKSGFYCYCCSSGSYCCSISSNRSIGTS